MKLVIDIPKDVKETLDRIESLSIKQLGDLQVAIMQGTPLPEGAEILTKEAYSNLCLRTSKAVTDAVDRVTTKEHLSSCEVTYPKIGKWRTVKHYGRDYYQCTYCSMERINDHSRGWNYCPFCGAKMSDVDA